MKRQPAITEQRFEQNEVRAFAERTKNGFARALTLAAYRVFPDFELFNLKSQAANELPVAHGAA